MAFKLFSDDLKLLGGVKTFREYHVCACIDETLWSLDAFFKSVNSFGVSSCANDEFTVGNLKTGLPWNSDLIDHLCGWYELFTVQVPTSFWKDLILNVKPGSSAIKELIDSSRTHFTLPKSSISISNDGKVGERRHILNNLGEFVQSSESNIGDTWWGSECTTWNIECSEAMLGSQSGNKSIVASGYHETVWSKKLSELLASVDELHLWLSEINFYKENILRLCFNVQC